MSLKGQLIVRSATLDDLPTLLEFEQGIIHAERPFDPSIRPDPVSYYDIAAMIGAEDADVAVAVLDERLVGSGYVKKMRSRPYVQPEFHAQIGFLFVNDHHRGRGINQKVLDYLFEWAKAKDLLDVRLTVYPDNAPAMRAYEKAGFKPYILEMRRNLNELP